MNKIKTIRVSNSVDYQDHKFSDSVHVDVFVEHGCLHIESFVKQPGVTMHMHTQTFYAPGSWSRADAMWGSTKED